MTNTATPTARYFATLETGSAVRSFAHLVLNAFGVTSHGTQFNGLGVHDTLTEGWAAREAGQLGVDAEAADEVVDTFLDLGLLRSTMTMSEVDGVPTMVPALTRIPLHPTSALPLPWVD